MPVWSRVRLVIALILLGAGLYWVLHTKADSTHVTLYVTAIVCAVTTIYALFTYEILLQNQAMARAATDSTRVMQQTLRFSYAPNLIFRTINTKDPTFKELENCTPVNNEDYQRALTEYGEGGQQKEFIFAIIENVGRGAATSLTVDTTYNVTDNSSPAKNYSVNRIAQLALLLPDRAVGLCICVSKVPTNGDRVQIVSATMTTSDYYLDALGQAPHTTEVKPEKHYVELEKGSVVQVA
jgi:hypothetical protein